MLRTMFLLISVTIPLIVPKDYELYKDHVTKIHESNVKVICSHRVDKIKDGFDYIFKIDNQGDTDVIVSYTALSHVSKYQLPDIYGIKAHSCLDITIHSKYRPMFVEEYVFKVLVDYQLPKEDLIDVKISTTSGKCWLALTNGGPAPYTEE